MKRIIKEVLQAEAKVNTSLQEARSQAAALRAAAEKEVAAKLNEAREQSREIVQTAVEQAKQTAERLRTEKLAQAEAASDTLLDSHAETMDKLVNELCQVILGTEGSQP